MRTKMKLPISGMCFLSIWITFSLGNRLRAQPKSENMYDGVQYIIDQFDHNKIIAIGETHGKVEVTDFFIQLIQNPQFAGKVDYLVIEMGNHLFQSTLDRYIAGEEVETTMLYKLWRDHTSCLINDSDNTGMIRLLNAVRNLNVSSDQNLRVLAGDPAIDWKEVDCLQKYYKHLGARDAHYTEIVKKYVVDESKKGLIIMGNSHFNKEKTKYMKANQLDNPITTLSKEPGSKMLLLNIMTASGFPYDKLKSVSTGSVITTNDQWLGNMQVSSPFLKDIPLSIQTDGIIYLGNREDFTMEKVSEFNDPEYETELNRRQNLAACE